jgi:hypothetical protein
MAKLEIEISSKALEKGIDAAKGFLNKLIGPAIEETGLLLKDQIALWRVKNQVKILYKTKAYCEKNNITPKTVALKLLCPLLDYAGLEEEEVLQDKWAYLLGNMVDSAQNIDNHVFPYILSQLSVDEFLFLEEVLNEKTSRIQKWTLELEKFQTDKLIKEAAINNELIPLNKELQRRHENNMQNGEKYISSHDLQSNIYALERELKTLQSKEQVIFNRIKEPGFVSPENLLAYQVSNLIRLGLVKVILRPYTNTQTLEIPNNPNKEYLTVDFDMEIESDLEEHTLTELGELFIKSCNEKQNG